MRILFVKTSSLGDVIHNCPAVSDVHRMFPRADIDWVVEEAFVDVVAMHHAVRNIVPVAVRRWRSGLMHAATWKEIAAFRRKLRLEFYDLVIDTQGLVKSALVASLARGCRHGLDAGSARESAASWFYDHAHPVPVADHAVARNRMLSAASCGYQCDGPCEYGLASGAVNALRPGSRYCVLLSMTSRQDKLWPESRWIELTRELDRNRVECLLPWGSPSERLRCERIVAGARAGVVLPALSIGGLAALMAESAGVVGVDTGLVHLAVALGAPSVGIYVSTDPARTGLYGGRRTLNLGGPGLVPEVAAVLAGLEAVW